jgi:lipopolysaccharide biosynthesis glycosyltransferase
MQMSLSGTAEPVSSSDTRSDPVHKRPASSPVDVTYVLDRGFLKPTLVSAWSLLCQRPADVTLRLLATEEIPELVRAGDQLQALFPDACIDIRHDLRLAHGQITRGHVSPASLSRLLLPKLVEGRTLYLDGDTLICRDPAPLYHADLQGHPIGACRDLGVQKALWHRRLGIAPSRKSRRNLRDLDRIAGMISAEHYFNAGVMVMDLPRIRELGLDRQMADVAAAVELRKSHDLRFNDQNWLNVVFDGKAHLVDPAWNALWGNRISARPPFPESEQRAYAVSRAAPGILHFTGRAKPWLIKSPLLHPKRWPWVFLYQHVQKTLDSVLSG